MKIRPEGAELFHADRQTDTRLIVALRNFANAPSKVETVKPFLYRDADKSLARPGRKQAIATEDFGFHISYL